MEIRAVEPEDLFYTVITEKQDDPPIEYCWIAEHPELPGLICSGRTEQEAVQALANMTTWWIDELRAEGLHIPKPNEHRGRADWNDSSAYTPDGLDDYKNGLA